MDPEGGPHSPKQEAPTPDEIPKYQRNMRSLNFLATRFVRLLEVAENGVVDLKEAVRVLEVRHKRRIYDITNVLEGVGLIVKISKNLVKWMGTESRESEHQVPMRLRELKSELEDLEELEFMLDQQKHWVEQSIRNTKQDCSNLTYVTHEDVCNCFSDHTVLTVRGPPGTQLDVPIPKAVKDSPVKYQIHLRSINGPIDVVLLNKCSVGSAPVFLPMPPPEEILQNAKLAMTTLDNTENSAAQTSVNTNHTTFKRTSMEDI
ncbi:Transcription factor E2F5 [Channa argus]|uniref:Transcription factor E2F5 n=1 Tax=Channa argus TaxID=215402 RepID=A0A6G1P8L8_CHAAH|nr:Transcription factor E2F5 [Channa argus]